MDLTEMSNLSDTELAQLLRTEIAQQQNPGEGDEATALTGEGQATNPPEPEVRTLTLRTGQQISGTADELNDQLLAVVENQNQTSNQTQIPQYNKDEFERRLGQNPYEGISYLFQTKAGFDPIVAILNMAQTVQTQGNTLREIQEQTSLGSIEGFDNSDKNRQTVRKVMSDRGWEPSSQTFKDAIAVAQAEGSLPEEKSGFSGTAQPPEAGQFIPPQVGSGAATIEGSSLPPDLEQRAWKMPKDQLKTAIETLYSESNAGN